MHGGPSFTFAIALAAGVLAQVLARALGVPSLVLLLGTGVLLGPDVLGWLVPDELGDGLFHLVRLAVALILFEGSLALDLRRLRRESTPIQRLITVGALVTAVGGTLAARACLAWPWSLCALFGTLVVVTGPTVIRPLLRQVPLRPRLATVLEAEGLLIDPVGAILAAVALDVVLGATADSLAQGILDFTLSFGVGAAAGLLAGFAVRGLLRAPKLVPDEVMSPVALGLVLAVFVLSDAIVPESGILAAVVAGVVAGNGEQRPGRDLGELEERLSFALIGLLFVLLAADVRIAEVLALGGGGLAVVLALVAVVRPLGVWLSTRGSELELRERAFLAWVAPRGVVAATVASLFAVVLDAEGFPGGSELRALVFLTIAVTVLLLGGTAGLVARALGVRAPARSTAAILGAEELALALAGVLREGGCPVLLLDSNPDHCRAAQERGFPVVYGNALEPRTLARARLDQAALALGLTANDEVNALFAREAREVFGVPEACVAVRPGSDVTARYLDRRRIQVLFGAPTDVERWNVRLRHGSARVERLRRAAAGAATAAPQPRSERGWILLAVRRGGSWQTHREGIPAGDADLAAAVVHGAEADEARRELAQLGWVVEDEAKVEPARGA